MKGSEIEFYICIDKIKKISSKLIEIIKLHTLFLITLIVEYLSPNTTKEYVMIILGILLTLFSIYCSVFIINFLN